MKLVTLAFIAAYCCMQAASLPTTPGVVRLNVSTPGESLTAADIRVLDEGKPQQIVSLKRSAVQPVLVLLDLFNTRLSDQGMLVKEVTEGLQAIAPTDRVYLYVLTHEGRLHPVHALPANEAEAAESAGAWASQAGTVLRKTMEDIITNKRTNFFTGQRVTMTFGALESLGSRLAALQGHKNLLWITRGVPVGFREKSRGNEVDYRKNIIDLSRTLDECDVSVIASELPGSLSEGGDVLGNRETLRMISAMTGGRYLGGNVNTRAAIADAVQAASSSYAIAYHPDPQQIGKTQRALKITASSGSLLAPSAYVEYPREENKIWLEGAVASVFPSAGIRLQASAARAAKDTYNLQIRIDPASVLMDPTAELEFRMILMLADGKRSISDAAHLSAKDAEGLTTGGEFPFPHGVEKVRLLVKDLRTGETGWTTISLHN